MFDCYWLKVKCYRFWRCNNCCVILKVNVVGTFNSFEEIDAWKLARLLADRIYRASLDGPFSKDYKLKDQTNGSSGSVMDNIAEGFERDGTREFIQFLAVAKGSIGETRSQLYRALDRHYITKEQFEELTNDSLVISKKISSLIKYLNNTKIKGSKFPGRSKS